MPLGPYADFNDCVMKNGDKASPEGFCAWLHHKIVGTWPSGMSAEKYPEPFVKAYDAALVADKPEKDAYAEAIAAAEAEGFEMTRFGFVKKYQSPDMKNIRHIKIFAAGTWTDSAGIEKTWMEEDLDKMVEAFEAGVPVIVPAKCGHTSDEFNTKIAEALGVPIQIVTGDHGEGQIKLGNMTSLERVKGGLLEAGFDNVPEPIADLIEMGLYSTVSVEIEDQIGEYGPAITGVALLGAEEPAVDKATTEGALVFGGSRKGARVYRLKVGEDIPADTLRAEFEEIKGKIADVIKGKRGAPIFRALFGNMSELFERMTASGSHSAKGGEDAPGNKSNKGGTDNMLKTLQKKLQGKKPEEIRAMTLPDLVKLFEGEDAPKVDDLAGIFQDGDLGQVAAALGLGEEASIDDVLATIKALVDKAAAGGEPEAESAGAMTAELKKATERIAALEGSLAGQANLAAWKEKTKVFTSIPGTPDEHAASLTAIEATAGKEAAESQFKALEHANKLTGEATKIVGTNRSAGTTDFDNEVKKYMAEHDKATKVQAIEAVSTARPDLYFARRDDWEQ